MSARRGEQSEEGGRSDTEEREERVGGEDANFFCHAETVNNFEHKSNQPKWNIDVFSINHSIFLVTEVCSKCSNIYMYHSIATLKHIKNAKVQFFIHLQLV